VSEHKEGSRGDQRTGSAAAGKREVRWSARRKEEVVMRLLRGESLDLLARECGQPAGRISAWRDEFLRAGREGLRARPRAPEQRELTDAQRKIGAQAIEIDTLKALLAKKGAPQSPRRSR
jgi:hypothetical protein